MLIRRINLINLLKARFPVGPKGIPRRCQSSVVITANGDISMEIQKAIEEKWSKHVYGLAPKSEATKSADKQERVYILSMFPYPSGRLHFGHVRVYTLSDVLARYHKLRGRDVFHPMGWDAFGLPAENAARDKGVDPAVWTKDNIALMKNQIIKMGCQFDWDSELATCNPDYYRWSQWLFLKLFENGAAYKKKSHVYWDPVDQTVLAEEQVDPEMRSWRSGAVVEKKLLSQWFIRTTKFAEQLSSGLDSPTLKEGWKSITTMQRNWIGPILGYFSDCNVLTNSDELIDSVRLWFLNPDSLKKARFVVLSQDHYLAKSSENIAKTFSNGMQLMNFTITNPATGSSLIVFTGPPEVTPLVPQSSDCRLDELLCSSKYPDIASNDESLTQINEMYDSLQVKPVTKLVDKNKKLTYEKASLRLRDWLVSRQRKWGTPIPMISCLDCGEPSAVDESRLPFSVHSDLTGMKCSSCGSSNVVAESDTLDTFFDSSWYFFRYLDSKNDSQIFDPKKIEHMIPVHTYIGGKEHATLHLYYARFMTHFLESLNLSPYREPFQTLIPVGVVAGETYQLQKTAKYLPKEQVIADGKKLKKKDTGEPVVKLWEKMSKSKLNGVDPDELIREYGVDITRLLSMADVAPVSPRKWTPAQFPVYLNFQRKTWLVMQRFAKYKEEDVLKVPEQDGEEWAKREEVLFNIRNYYVVELLHQYEATCQMNVAITRLQALFNEFLRLSQGEMKESIQFERALGIAIICLYPIMPAYTAELWNQFRDLATFTEQDFNLDKEIWHQKFPRVDPNYKTDFRVLLKPNKDVVATLKLPYDLINTLDINTALEMAYDEEEVEKRVPRESLIKSDLQIEPDYRATLWLTSSKPVAVAPEKKKRKKVEQV